MPTPHGRDRVRETEEGEVVLSSFRPKGWSGRPAGDSGAAGNVAGTAVDWDGAVWEVLRVETPPSGGVRYTLRPWEEGRVIRQMERYGPEPAASAPAPETGAFSAPLALPPGAARLRERWLGVPSSLRVLLLGFVPGVLLSSFCLFQLMGEGMSFFVHELGHTAVALLFGRLAVPAVILTITFDQSRLAAAAIWVLLAGLAWRLRSVPRWREAAASALLVYPVVAFTDLHLDAIDVAGHLAELAVAAFFFRRAATGGLFSEWERPVYAFFAWYLWLRNVRLFFGIATDAQARTDYLTVAITGENDLVKVANGHGWDLAAVGAAALVAAVAIPAAGLFIAFRKGKGTPAG